LKKLPYKDSLIFTRKPS